MLDAKKLSLAELFLKTEYPAKTFLHTIGVHNPTMHQWAKRGYFHFNPPGRGKTLFLTGRKILHLACLKLISRASGSLKLHLQGLEESITGYIQDLANGGSKSNTRYCCLRFNLNSVGKYEWELTENPLVSVPYLSALDLDTILITLTNKMEV